MTGPRLVVPLRTAPPLNDIAASLRHLAAQIEAGAITPDAAHVALTFADSFQPAWYGFGNPGDRHTIAGVFMHCAQRALTDRESP